MKIEEFAKTFDCQVLGPEESHKILKLFDDVSLPGDKHNLSMKQEPDCFRFLKYVSDHHYVLGCPNSKGELEGMAMLAARPCYINGRPDQVAHFFDLRRKPKSDRTITTTDCKNFGLEFIRRGEAMEELAGCRIYQGSGIATNMPAPACGGKGLLKESGCQRPQREARHGETRSPERSAGLSEKAAESFLVSNLASCRMVNLYARLPKDGPEGGPARWSDKKISVSRGTGADRERLKTFLDKQNRLKMFGYIYNKEKGELERRLRDWDGFSMASFFIARDAFEEIIGAFGVFDQKIDILYLTSLELDFRLMPGERMDVFDLMLTALYESGLPGRYRRVSFCDYNRQSLLDVVKNKYLYETVPVRLYQLHAPEAREVYREDQMRYPPGHEMVLMP